MCVCCEVWCVVVQCGVVRLVCQVSAPLSCAKHLEPWLGSSDGSERERGSTLLVDLLNAYQTEHYSTEVSHVPAACPQTQWDGCGLFLSCVPPQETGGLDILGHLLGRLVPRATDPQLAVRHAALHCIQVCLRLGTCEQGGWGRWDERSVLWCECECGECVVFWCEC